MNKQMSNVVFVTSVVAVVVFCQGCFPSKEASMVKPLELAQTDTIESPAKVFLLDGSVVMFPEGFSVHNQTVSGRGSRYSLSWMTPGRIPLSFPLDSIAAATHYTRGNSAGMVIGSTLLVLAGTILTPAGIYCAFEPKACFGCCPTVYTADGDGYRYEAELFSYSVSRLMPGEDLDMLSVRSLHEDTISIRVTNEALETHHIDRFSLIAVEHPRGTQVFSTPQGSLVAIRQAVAPHRVLNRQGDDITSLVSASDGVSYAGDTSLFTARWEGMPLDWLDVDLTLPAGCKNVTAVLRLRNSLLSTVLFYDVVMRSQGVQALEWSDRMDSDTAYARQFDRVYQAFSGIRVSDISDITPRFVATIPDQGPIGWKFIAVPIPVTVGEHLQLRFEFFPDNFHIDQIAFDFGQSSPGPLGATEIPPEKIVDQAGMQRTDIAALVADCDDRELITEPGDSYRLFYRLPKHGTSDRSLAIRSKGYYTEWVRGSWLYRRPDAYVFDLNDVRGTLDQLLHRWSVVRNHIEQDFFQSRIPVRGER
jgi:hypothetical protein